MVDVRSRFTSSPLRQVGFWILLIGIVCTHLYVTLAPESCPPVVLLASSSSTTEKDSFTPSSFEKQQSTTLECKDKPAELPLIPPDIHLRYPSQSQRDEMYLKSKEIPGWSGEMTFDMVDIIGQVQTENGMLSRSIGEVGVHQGKSFSWLETLSWSHERTFALDVFDMQQYNVDKSGGAGLSVDSFQEHVDSIFASPQHAVESREHRTLIRSSSMEVTACDLVARGLTPVRLFSVDGAHTGEFTLNDMKLAASVLGPGGCLMVDDYLNPGWLGVQEGVHRFLNTERSRWAPLAIVAGKFWICDSQYTDQYLQALRQHLPKRLETRSPELGRKLKMVFQSKMYGVQMLFLENS